MKSEINSIIIVLTYICFRLIGLIAAPDLLVRGRLYYYYFFVAFFNIALFIQQTESAQKY